MGKGKQSLGKLQEMDDICLSSSVPIQHRLPTPSFHSTYVSTSSKILPWRKQICEILVIFRPSPCAVKMCVLNVWLALWSFCKGIEGSCCGGTPLCRDLRAQDSEAGQGNVFLNWTLWNHCIMPLSKILLLTWKGNLLCALRFMPYFP